MPMGQMHWVDAGEHNLFYSTQQAEDRHAKLR
jgi:hypothetical protein